MGANSKRAAGIVSIARMTSGRGITGTLGLTLFLGALVTLLVPATAHAADTDSVTPPLLVRLTGLTPSEIPRQGPITISGTVSNTSDETWSDINVHTLTSQAPITSRSALEEAARSDPLTTFLGPRLISAGTYVNIGDLPPGSTSSFTVRLKRSQLEMTGAPGVYWVGVQALGANADGRDDIADGRARTFAPLVPAKARAGAQLVIPLRQEVRRATNGSVYGPNRLAASLSPNGRLGRVAAFAGTATGLPLTWVVDPALLDAAADLADDNPPLSLGNGKRANQSSRSPTPSPSGNGAAPASDLDQDARSEAAAWLRQAHDLLNRGKVLGLPYADPDVSRLSRRDTGLIERARRLSAQLFTKQQLEATPAVAPPDGYLDPAALGPLGTGTTLLLADHGRPAAKTFWSSRAGQPLVLADSRTASGGPLPTPMTALGIRQRILADAALTAISGSHRPLVVVLPANFDPGRQWSESGFFSGLRVPWLSLEPLGPASGATTTSYDGLTYPAAARKQEPGPRDVAATRQLAHTANVLGDLLDSENDAETTLAGAALEASSYAAAEDRVRARVQVVALNAAIRHQMDKVRVLGTPFVTLSGGSGSLNVSLVNDLDQPVTVGLRAHTGSSDVRIDPYDPVSLGAGERTTIRLHAQAGSIGVHEVTLQPVTTGGDPLGTPFEFSLRTSEVGRYFWAVVVAGGLLLVAMIARRIRLRMRSSRWRQ